MTNADPAGWPELEPVMLGIGNDGQATNADPRCDQPSDCGTVLASGDGKADILKAILEPQQDADRQLPAAIVRPDRGQLIWLLDRPATAKLTGNYP